MSGSEFSSREAVLWARNHFPWSYFVKIAWVYILWITATYKQMERERFTNQSHQQTAPSSERQRDVLWKELVALCE
jgi:hypothetical protein